jgi:hypothetical protein
VKTAYVTTLCNGDGYLPGVEVLGKSLEASGSTAPRIVLLTSDISGAARGRLTELGWQMRDIEPSADTFRRMIAALSAAGSYDGGDQGFLNTFFADWYAMPVNHRLPVGYNMAHFIYQFLRGHPTLEATLEREAKIVHYMVQKPWETRTTLTGGSEAWWHVYFQAHPEKAQHWKEKVHAFEDWTFDHLASLVLG